MTTLLCMLLLLLRAVASEVVGRHGAGSSALLPPRPPPARLLAPPVSHEERTAHDAGLELEALTPALAITFPANHSWWQVPVDAGSLPVLPVYFSIHRARFQIPRDGYLLATGHKLPRDGLRYDRKESSFEFRLLEPGSHFITLVLQTWSHQRVPNSQTVLHVEVVVPHQRFHRQWRYVLEEQDRKPVALLNLPDSQPRLKPEQKQARLVDAGMRAARDASLEDAVSTPVCFISNMSGGIDGQKKMWLQLMKALGKERRAIGGDSSDGAHFAFDFQVKSFEDFQGESPMKHALRDLDIPLRSVAITISQTDAETFGVSAENGSDFLINRFYEAFPHARNSTSAVSEAEARQLHTVQPSCAASCWEVYVQELRSCRNGVVVFANSRKSADNALVLAARMAGARSIVMELANLYPEPIDVDVVLAPSHFAASHPSVLEAVQFKRSYVLSTGIDTDTFSPRSNKTSLSFVIGYVGRLATDKSAGMVLAMAKHVIPRCPSCRFRVIGDGVLNSHLKTLAREWNLTSAVEFLDGIYHDEGELARQFQAMDAYFSPSFAETLGIAGLEAMSVGLPVIGFQTGGVGEYLVDGYNGIALQDVTPEAFYDALDGLVRDSDRRCRMGWNARQTVLERFSLKKSIPKYVALYQRLGRGR